jgi:hypothetical protein
MNKWAPKPGEDLIDFAVSPDFRGLYAAQGMTWNYPPDQPRRQEPAPQKPVAQTLPLDIIRAYDARITNLTKEVQLLNNRLNSLERRQSGY